MTEVERTSDQLHRAFYGKAWHGPAVMVLLNDVSAAQASAHPVKNVHSTWEIVHHIGAWKDAVRRQLLGEIVELDDIHDWPSVQDHSDAAWQMTLEELTRRHTELEAVVAGLSELDLEKPSPGRQSSVYFLIHGLIQHDLYHAGQIALLIRAM